MTTENFTWVKTHKELVEIISKKRNQQEKLIDVLRKVGIAGLHDEDKKGKRFDLKEIDPFSFFCFIYKYGPQKRILLLQEIAKLFKVSIPTDELGVPSVNAQKVCLFPFESTRTNNEINRLWDFFESALKNNITDEQFQDILTIIGTGKTKLTEGLYNILPDKYFPINGPAKPYIKEVLGIDPAFNTYTEYISLLQKIKSKINVPFYELSYEAWKWNDNLKQEYFILGSRYGANNNVDVSSEMIQQSLVAVGFAKEIDLTNYFQENVDEIKSYLESKGESQSSINALRIFLSLKVGDKIAIKASGSPRGKTPFLSIIAIAEVEERNGKIYNYNPEGLIHTINVKYLNTGVYKEFELGGYGMTIHRLSKEEHIKQIFESNYQPINNNSEFDKLLGKLNPDDKEVYFKFLREVIEKYNLQKGDERIVFSLREKRLNFTIGQRYCLTIRNQDEFSFGVISTKKINKNDYQFDGYEPRPYYSLVNNAKFQSLNKSNIFSAIENELKRTKRSSFLKFNNSDFENYVFKIKTNTINNKSPMDISLNTILYGPPGTGKTYLLKSKFMKDFTSTENSITKEDFLIDIIQHCSWWQVIALALRQLGKTKVSGIYNHQYVKIKTQLSNSTSITQTIWGQLQSHAIEECEEVKVQRRMAPLIFNKSTDSHWEIIDSHVMDQASEIIELENKINDFSKVPNTKIERFEFVTFHQSYSYEDFVEGIKPELNNTDVSYKIEEGVFQKMCNRARNDKANNYAIFIDEINRGNISSIFGELITLIEDDKREGQPNEIKATLPYSQKPFSVPSNLYIIGTMNTADRSVEALDTALRRRFSFIELNPDAQQLTDSNYACTGIDLSKLLTAINARVEKLLDKDYCIGHSYFMSIKDKANPLSEIRTIFQNKILPLLQEYFYGDWGKIMLVLGDGFVEKKTNSISFLSTNKYDNYEDFEEKPIYKFTNAESWTLNTFRVIYE